MTRRSAVLAALLGAILACGRPAIADPIPITGGQLAMGSSDGSLLLLGTRDFTLSGQVSVTDGVFRPWLQCSLTLECVPGAVIDVGAFWVGLSFRSTTVTLDGETYTNVGGLISESSASARFIGSVVAPPLSSTSATVSTQFQFQGEFTYLDASSQRIVESLNGTGTVTLLLSRNPALNAWSYSSARYDFGPVPEPAGLLLAISGLIGVGARILRHHRPL